MTDEKRTVAEIDLSRVSPVGIRPARGAGVYAWITYAVLLEEALLAERSANAKLREHLSAVPAVRLLQGGLV